MIIVLYEKTIHQSLHKSNKKFKTNTYEKHEKNEEYGYTTQSSM